MARFSGTKTTTGSDPLIIQLSVADPALLQPRVSPAAVTGFVASAKGTTGLVGKPILTTRFTPRSGVAGTPVSLDGHSASAMAFITTFTKGTPIPDDLPPAAILPPCRVSWQASPVNGFILRRSNGGSSQDAVLLYADGGGDGWDGTLFWEEF